MFFLPLLAVHAILTKIRVDLENKLSKEKANNKIYNVDKKRLDKRYERLKKKYPIDISTLNKEVKNLNNINNEIINKKDNMKITLQNNVSAIEPVGYPNTLEPFDSTCPYSGSGSGVGLGAGIAGGAGIAAAGTATGMAQVGRGTGKGSGSGAAAGSGSGTTTPKYDPVPHYTVDLYIENQAASTNTSTSLYRKYKHIIDQNTILLQRQQYIDNQFTRHNNKFEHYSNNITKINVFNNLLFYLYYILIVMVILKLFFDTPEWSLYYKIFIIISFILFPLVAYTIEMIFYNIWIFSYSFLYGKVYNNLSYSNKVILNNTTDLTTKE